MKTRLFVPIVFSSILMVSCSSPSLTKKSTTQTSNSNNQLSSSQLVGGLPIEQGAFISSGRFSYSNSPFDSGACALTRVGPKHFLTAGHCNAQTKINLQGQDLRFSREYPIAKHDYRDNAPSDTTPYFEPNPDTGYMRPTNTTLTGKRDWGLIDLNLGTDPGKIIENYKFLNANYKIREIANPGTIRNGNTVMVAGFGRSIEDNEVIGVCDRDSTPQCGSDYETSRAYPEDGNISEDVNKKYAFFQVNRRGSGKEFLFTSKASLVKTTLEGMLVYTFDQDIDETSTDPRGLVALGDSGGPVLNGEQKLIGVIQGSLQGEQIPYGFWNVFSSFDYQTVNEEITKPSLYYAPARVMHNAPFFVMGQNLGRASLKSSDGKVMPLDAACEALTAQQKQDIKDIGLQLGVDYQCYKAPVISGSDRMYNFSNKATGEKIGEVVASGLNTRCVTEVKVYSTDNGAKWGYTGYTAGVAWQETRTISETKALALADATRLGNIYISREGKPAYDGVYGENCAGGTGGQTLEEAEAIANSTIYVPWNPEEVLCSGGGVVHYTIWFGMYEIGKTSCIHD